MPKKDSSQEKVEKFKSLAGSIAHETRKPLTAIKGCCEVIKDNLNQAIEFIDLISISSNRGLSIIDMILQNIGDEEIDKGKFSNLSIAIIVESAVKEYAFESEEQKELVNVDLENDFMFKGDETLMIFVLLNLLKNSLYYKAKINIWLDGDKRFLYFKDNGVGIPKDKLKSIFDSFCTSNKKGGIGLGLPFCKKFGCQAFSINHKNKISVSAISVSGVFHQP